MRKNFFGYLCSEIGAAIGTQIFSRAQLEVMDAVPALDANGNLRDAGGNVIVLSTATELAPLDAAPVDSAIASNALTSDEEPIVADETVTLGGKVYTFVDELTTDPDPVEGEVLTDENADVALGHLAAAINHAAGEGVTYQCAAENELAESSAVVDHELTFDARVAGAAGNDIGLSTDAASLTANTATFEGGIDGTPGVENQIGAFEGQPYFCTEAATILTTGAWKKITLEDLS